MVIVTGDYGARVFADVLERLEALTGSPLRVLPVENEFFGGNVAVAGLMVGSDIKRRLPPTSGRRGGISSRIRLFPGAASSTTWISKQWRRLPCPDRCGCPDRGRLGGRSVMYESASRRDRSGPTQCRQVDTGQPDPAAQGCRGGRAAGGDQGPP